MQGRLSDCEKEEDLCVFAVSHMGNVAGGFLV